MLKNPKAIVYMNEVLTLAKADGSLYEVACRRGNFKYLDSTLCSLINPQMNWLEKGI
jgi:hypothetical protein